MTKEFAEVQRFCEKSAPPDYKLATANGAGVTRTSTANNFFDMVTAPAQVFFTVTKIKVPTMTFYSPDNASTGNFYTGSATAGTSATGSSVKGLHISGTSGTFGSWIADSDF